MNKRIALPAAAAAALFLGLLLALSLLRPGTRALEGGVLLQQPRPISDFRLSDERGAGYGREDLLGHWTAIFPGFTHCPDICPDTLAKLRGVWQALPEDQRSRWQVVFLSVDPGRDTAEVLAQYVGYFSPEFKGLTGDKDVIDRLARELAIAYHYSPNQDGGYTVDHTAAIVLVDPQARVAGYLQPPFDIDTLRRDLQVTGRAS